MTPALITKRTLMMTVMSLVITDLTRWLAYAEILFKMTSLRLQLFPALDIRDGCLA